MSRPEFSSFRSRLWMLFVVCVLIAGYGYPVGWPAWQLCLILGIAPLLGLAVWLWLGRLRRYRMLFGLFGTLAVVGVYEAWEYDRIPTAVATRLNLPEPPGEPNLYFEYDLPAVEASLFPDSADSLLLKAVQLNYCTADGMPLHMHPYCLKYGAVDRTTIRETLESAIALSPKTNEDVYYSYVEVLKQTGADAAQIDAAADEWKRLFPFSDRNDPRTQSEPQRQQTGGTK